MHAARRRGLIMVKALIGKSCRWAAISSAPEGNKAKGIGGGTAIPLSRKQTETVGFVTPKVKKEKGRLRTGVSGDWEKGAIGLLPEGRDGLARFARPSEGQSGGGEGIKEGRTSGFRFV